MEKAAKSWDVELLSEIISDTFNHYLNETNYQYNVDFRTAFNQKKINKINEKPIFTWHIESEKPAAIAGEPLKGPARKASYNNKQLNYEGVNYNTQNLLVESIVSFDIYSDKPHVSRDIARNFRNFMIISRQNFREGLQIPDLFYQERTTDTTIDVDGTLIYTTSIKIYVKTIVITVEEMDVIYRIDQFISKQL